MWEEVARHRPTVLAGGPLRLVRSEVPDRSAQVIALAAIHTLHRGEQDALSLCLRERISVLLSDDTAARLAAGALGLMTHGTLGLLLRSVRRGLRSPTEIIDLLDAIPQRSTLHIRPSLLAEVIAQARREWHLIQ